MNREEAFFKISEKKLIESKVALFHDEIAGDPIFEQWIRGTVSDKELIERLERISRLCEEIAVDLELEELMNSDKDYGDYA